MPVNNSCHQPYRGWQMRNVDTNSDFNVGGIKVSANTFEDPMQIKKDGNFFFIRNSRTGRKFGLVGVRHILPSFEVGKYLLAG